MLKDYLSRQKASNFLSLIIFIGLIRCLTMFVVLKILFPFGNQFAYFPDSHMFERLAHNLILGHGFSLSNSAPFQPSMFKEPLYAFFIAATKVLGFKSINFIIFAQVLLNPLLAVFIYFIGKEIFNENIARWSAFLVALIPAYGEISLFIMTEGIFIVLLPLTILCVIKAEKYLKWSWFVLSGILLGISTLCRNTLFPLFLIYAIVLLLKKRNNINAVFIMKIVIFILSFAAIVTPWMYRNQIKLGLFSISRRGGELLAHQAAWAANFTPNQWKAYTLYLISGSLAKKIYPQVIGDNLGDYEYRTLMRTDYVNSLLNKYSEGKVERLLFGEAIGNMRRHPFKFLLLTLITYIQSFKYFESISLMLIKGYAGWSWVFSLLRALLFFTGVAYTLFAFYGAFSSRGSFNSSLIIITISYFHIVLAMMGIIPGGLQRHILPITAFYSFFFVIALQRLRCA